VTSHGYPRPALPPRLWGRPFRISATARSWSAASEVGVRYRRTRPGRVGRIARRGISRDPCSAPGPGAGFSVVEVVAGIAAHVIKAGMKCPLAWEDRLVENHVQNQTGSPDGRDTGSLAVRTSVDRSSPGFGPAGRREFETRAM
jgi:hypothetical protein